MWEKKLYSIREVQELIKQVQSDAYNQALEDVIETLSPWKDDKNLILKLKR